MFLCLTILFSVFSVSASAKSETENVPQIINCFEKHGTNFVSLLGKLWNMIVKTDETVAQKVNTKFYGGIKTGTVGNLEPETKYICQWFDPISGEFYEEKEFTSSAFGTHYIGEKPKATDMAIRIVKGD